MSCIAPDVEGPHAETRDSGGGTISWCGVASAQIDVIMISIKRDEGSDVTSALDEFRDGITRSKNRRGQDQWAKRS
jgi:hypothetical protein